MTIIDIEPRNTISGGEKVANRFQRFLFNLSTLSPLGMIFVVVCWIQLNVPPLIEADTGNLHIQTEHIILLGAGLIFVLFSFWGISFVTRCKKRLETVTISAESASCNDAWAFVVVISYALPLAGFVIEEYNWWIVSGILLLLSIILWVSSIVLPSPLLLLFGYHFYKVTNVDGGGECIMLSSRKSINNSKTIRKVICAFDYFLIERR